MKCGQRVEQAGWSSMRRSTAGPDRTDRTGRTGREELSGGSSHGPPPETGGERVRFGPGWQADLEEGPRWSTRDVAGGGTETRPSGHPCGAGGAETQGWAKCVPDASGFRSHLLLWDLMFSKKESHSNLTRGW